MSGSVFYYKIIIFGSKKTQSFTYSALLCCALLCSAVLCCALLCCQCIAPRSAMSSSFSRCTPLSFTIVLNISHFLIISTTICFFYYADGAACPQAAYHRQAGRSLPSVDNFYALSVMLDATVNDLIAERTHF